MPSGVVDAFKNLIRHGKNHGHARQDKSEDSTTSAEPAPRAIRQEPPKETPKRAPSPVQQAKMQTVQEAQEQAPTEDHEPKEKMPLYAGLEQFKLVEKMGDGAFSNVYKAVDTVSRKHVAVKVVRKFELNSTQAGNKHLNPEFKKKPRVTERANILKEVQIMRGTNHPSIVKLISFSESQEHYFLVLELMPGGELFHQIVKLTYFSENLARHVILQVAHGIRYLHEERGVVHRDIKPENLLFDRIPIIPSKVPQHRPYDEEKEDEGEFIPGVGGGGIGRVKIADFGLSKIVWDEQTQTPCGTVGYTAPEIVKDERYSKSVDMWAMGCVLYTLLSGFPPFFHESIHVLTEQVARGQYTFLSPWWDDISHSSKDLIQHLLCVDPAQRYTIDEFLAHPWCNAAPAPPPPPTPMAYPAHLYGKSSRPLDSPLLTAARGGRNADGGRSPGVATLKEAFDVTYAVHRMEEEGARRRAYNGRGGAGARGFLGGLNEDDEDEDDPRMDAKTGNTRAPDATIGGASHPDAGRAGQRDRGKKPVGGGQTRGFELQMEGATLLGRRGKKRVGESSPLISSPLAPLKDQSLPPGSPMRM